jgi:hypothetical protein
LPTFLTELDNMTIVIEGRLVRGHPMKAFAKKDKAGQPKLNKNGQPQMETFVAVAVPKNGTTDFKQTDFGKALEAAALAAWPKGEYRAKAFAWKVVDGDSAEADKKGIAPREREGYPGHWVVSAATQIGVNCYHVGKYKPHEQIQAEAAIKTGDYCALAIDFAGNNSTESPGMYVNPVHFVLTRPGEAIVSEASGPAAEEVFAHLGGAASPPPPPPAAAAPPPPPHNPLPKTYTVQGVAYTAEQLKGFGWTDEQIATLG